MTNMMRDELLTKLAMELSEWPKIAISQFKNPLNKIGSFVAHDNGDVFFNTKSYVISVEEHNQRRAKLINEPDDAEAADTPARYKTQDANGEWWWHDTMPYIAEDHAVWDSDGWQTLAARGKVPADHDWQTTLREVKPMTTTPNAPTWPTHPAHKAQLNPAASSLTDSQAQEFAVESGTCSDGTQCGTFAKTAYCDDCPNQPKVPTHQQMIDRCNATLAFWPSHPEGAQQIMPVKHPWQWRVSINGVFLVNLEECEKITRNDWCAGEDLSEPQCIHYGGECGENGYCAPCPNCPEPQYAPESVAFKQPVNAHYQRTYKGVLFDPYRIAAIWRMQGGPREQIMKKCLRFTEKGQTEREVVNEIRNALDRWEEMLDEDAAR